MTKHEKILVIGSNSFSGASFAAYALRDGAHVIGISRSSEPNDALLPYKWRSHDKFQFHRLDLNKDIDKIDEVVRSFEPEYIVNFAAQSMVAQSWEYPQHWFQTNVLSTLKLHEKLRKHAFIKKYVYASTPEVYGATGGLVTEDAPFHPSTPYAVSKASCDMMLLAYHKAYGFPVAFTRSANVCGPGQQLFRIIPKTVLCVLMGQKLRLEGGGHSVRSFIHIDDVSEGTLRVARVGRCGEAYHLATDRSQSIRNLVQEICRQLGASFEDLIEETPPRLAQDSAYLLDFRKATLELSWKPIKTIEDIIRETIEWMKTNYDVIRQLPSNYIHKE